LKLEIDSRPGPCKNEVRAHAAYRCGVFLEEVEKTGHEGEETELPQ